MSQFAGEYDVAVIGGGPAGLSACVFTTRAGLSTICFEKLAIGGQAALSYEIENYPAFKIVSGFDLTQKMFEQAKDSGTHFQFGTVNKIKKLKTCFSIQTTTETYQAKKIIIASGTLVRKLGLNEEKFIGRGVSYCASCDGNFFKNKTVAVIGGGDSAFQAVEYLSRVAKKIILLNRSDRFKANLYRVEKAKKLKNVEIKTNVEVKELIGEDVLRAVKLNNGKTLEVEGVFVMIGHEPNLNFLDFDLKKDSHGYLVVDESMKTSEHNVYACGDIVSKNFKQVITACADGAIAGNSCVGE